MRGRERPRREGVHLLADSPAGTAASAGPGGSASPRQSQETEAEQQGPEPAPGWAGAFPAFPVFPARSPDPARARTEGQEAGGGSGSARLLCPPPAGLRRRRQTLRKRGISRPTSTGRPGRGSGIGHSVRAPPPPQSLRQRGVPPPPQQMSMRAHPAAGERGRRGSRCVLQSPTRGRPQGRRGGTAWPAAEVAAYGQQSAGQEAPAQPGRICCTRTVPHLPVVFIPL